MVKKVYFFMCAALDILGVALFAWENKVGMTVFCALLALFIMFGALFVNKR